MILKAQLMVQLFILTLAFQTRVQAKATSTNGQQSAIEDGSTSTPPTEESETDVVGCPTDEGFLPLGEARPLEGCAELYCAYENHTLSAYIRRCQVAVDQIEEGCKIVPRPELEFPKCCELVIECKRITPLVYPVVYTAANISLLERNDSDNTIFKEHNVFKLPKNQMLQTLDSSTTKTNGDLDTLTMKDRHKREVVEDPTLVREYDRQEEGCETGNGILKPLQYIPLKGCAQLKCIPDKGGFSLVVIRCDMSENKTTPEGCTQNPKPEQQYPECCTLEYICERTVSKLVPVTFTAANISQLEIDSDANLLDSKIVDKEIEPLITIMSETSNTDYSKRRTRATDEIQNSMTKQNSVEEGCVMENGLLKMDQKIPLEGCSQLVCVPDNDTFSFRILSCNLPEGDIEEGCEIVPRPELKFPECCEIMMVCQRVVTTIFPVFYNPANISLLERNDIDNIIPRDEDFSANPGEQNPPNEMVINQNPLETSNDRQRRDTDFEKEDVHLKEEVGCVTENGTLKPNEEVPFTKCGRLKCSYVEGELFLVAESCSPPKLPENLKACTVISTPDVQFPECCSVLTYVCRKEVETLVPVVYTAQNISELQGNVTLNLVDETDATEENGQDNTQFEISPLASDFKDLKHSSVKSKSVSKHRIRRGAKQTEGNANKDTKIAVDETEKITKQGSVKKAKIHLDKKEKTTTHKESKQTPDKNVKKEKIDTKPYDYKTFIERSRRNAKPSETKPTFFLPLSRRQSSRKREISSSDSKVDEDDLKLKDSMFVTSTPKPHSNESIKILEDKEKVKTNNIKKEDRNKKIGRLSALLSSRNLRVTTEAPKEEEKKTKTKRRKTVRGTGKKETKEKKEVEKTSEVKETPTRRPRLRNRTATANATDLTQIAERRRLYASRLNRFRASVRNKADNEDKSESTKKEVIRKKEKKEADENKEEKETPKSRREQSKKNFSLRRRFNNRRRGKSVTEEEAENEDKKEETKKLPIRSRLNRKQREDVKKEKADEEKSSTVVNQRRRKPAVSKIKSEAKTKAETKKNKTTLKRIRNKPLSRIKSLRIKNKTADTEKKSENNEKKLNDSKNLRADKTTKTTKKAAPRGRISSSSRNLRRRLQEQKKRKETEASKKKEKSKQTKSKSEKKSKATTVKETKPESAKETKPESLKKEQPVVKTQTEILKDPKEDQKPIKQIHPIPYYPSFLEEDRPVATSPPLYDPEYDSDYPFVPKFKSRLEDFDKFYKYPEEDEELSLSSSHKEQAEKSPNTEENEIPEVPDVPNVPMKITTVSFSTSRRSFKSSKSRNTSKNFKETPTVYDTKESFKSSKFR